jgi:hypothetical protein
MTFGFEVEKFQLVMNISTNSEQLPIITVTDNSDINLSRCADTIVILIWVDVQTQYGSQ